MATVGNTYLNLVDTMKSTQDGKTHAAIIELLMQNTGILDDAVAVACNNGNKHKHTIRTKLPSNAWGALYQGIPQSKSAKQQVEDTTGFLEAASAVDTRMGEVTSGGLLNSVRLSEAAAHAESMAQEAATGLFYHDTATTPEKFKGLDARYGQLATFGEGNQIVDAGGIGSDNTSIYFVTWGEDTTHLIYPAGATAGLKREDHGKQRALDANGNPYYIFEETFRWHLGLAIADYRYNSRIANIDVSNLIADPTSIDGAGTSIYDVMRKAFYKLQSRRANRAGNNMKNQAGKIRQLAIYCNSDVLEALDAVGTNSGANDNFVRLRPMEIQGEEVLTYRGIPIRETDALLNTEARVV
ncbi:major capsid protein [uncultured Paraglaciecola sp.]|uniref:major capsid protein n=1 Tax=uncultured Paraglaciecola sp. TaxID=1765024 RepID=UPI0026052515|nr:hypothetical protein [uncultured Paraglaciecola sp.]